MNVRDLVLNIAINLNRISKFVMEGNEKRVNFFVNENKNYIKEVDKLELSSKFEKTFRLFKEKLPELKDPEDFLTWANILTHRAKLA